MSSAITLNTPRTIQIDEDLLNDILKNIDDNTLQTAIATHIERKKQLKHLKTKELTKKEAQALHDEYSKIKDKHIKKYETYLNTIAKDIYIKITVSIDDWATKKKERTNKAYDDKLDILDRILLMGLMGTIQSVTSTIPSSMIEEYTKNAYNDSAKYYQKLESDKINEAVGQRPTPKGEVTYKPYDIRINQQFNNYTLRSLKTVHEKYRPAMEKIIREGYKKGLDIDTIARQLKQAVNPSSKYTKTDYIWKRIARTEMATYTELAKLDAWNNIGIGKKQFLSMMDSHVCVFCRGYNGQILDLDDYSIVIPVHPFCRCCWIPVYDPGMLFLPLVYDLATENS